MVIGSNITRVKKKLARIEAKIKAKIKTSFRLFAETVTKKITM